MLRDLASASRKRAFQGIKPVYSNTRGLRNIQARKIAPDAPYSPRREHPHPLPPSPAGLADCWAGYSAYSAD
jgi:hypothetical protein